MACVRAFYIRWTPHPVIVTIGDNRDYIRVLLYSYYATITGWGGPPKFYNCQQGNPDMFFASASWQGLDRSSGIGKFGKQLIRRKKKVVCPKLGI